MNVCILQMLYYNRIDLPECNISSQDVSKFTYITLDKYISD